MATGFCPNLLFHIDEIANGNAPSKKMHVAGALAAMFCCQNSSVSPLNDIYNGGHTRGLTVKYKQRPTLNDITTTDTCDVDRVPSYLEWNFPASNYAQSAFFLSDAQIQQYCLDASAMRSSGRPPTSVMQEIYEEIISTANILLKYINRDIVTELATEAGVNVTTGTDTGKVINISRDGNKLILDNGMIDFMVDMQENEICDDVCLIGGGLWSAWDQARLIACCNSAGMDISKIGMPQFFFDKDSQTIWGDNAAFALAPGSVKFIGRNRFVGPYAGERGPSTFATLPLPVNEFNSCAEDCLRDLVFDMQVKYHDCPTTININGTPTAVDRGTEVILSKSWNLWIQPTTAYASGDPLYGTNGILKYYMENTTATDASSPYPGY